MNAVQKFSFTFSLLSLFMLPATAQTTVSSPLNNAQVTSPVSLSAMASTCSAQAVTSMGYTVDSNPAETIVTGSSIAGSIAMAIGAHVIHVLAYGADDATCDTDVAVTIVPPETGPAVPAIATSVSSIQVMGGWKGMHDTGGKGSSSGVTELVGTPSMSGTTRKFVTSYKNDGDERYSVTFANDANATNFLYDAWVYFNSSEGLVGNLEMDLNQVMPNGENAIFAFQCAGDSNTWDYTGNAGTPEHGRVDWIKSSQPCNPRTWSINAWHHVQIAYCRDDLGNVTYESVWLDGNEQVINATVPSAFALRWAPGTLQTQFQVDGIGKSGTTTVYLDNLTIYRW